MKPTGPQLCASCVEERVDCKREWLDGKLVWLCYPCREGQVRLGNYSFGSGRDARVGGDGNRQRRK